MKFYLICDNEDTALGLRLAGIEGIVTNSAFDVKRELQRLSQSPETGVILINESLASLCSDIIGNFRKAHNLPLITEIPDRHSTGASNPIADYVNEAIGIKL